MTSQTIPLIVHEVELQIPLPGVKRERNASLLSGSVPFSPSFFAASSLNIYIRAGGRLRQDVLDAAVELKAALRARLHGPYLTTQPRAIAINRYKRFTRKQNTWAET